LNKISDNDLEMEKEAGDEIQLWLKIAYIINKVMKES
jgi:hypothetical protein